MSNSQIIIAFILNQEEGLHSLYIPSLTTKRLLLFHNVQSSITLLQTVVKYGNNLSRCIFSTAFSTLTHVRMCAVSAEEVQIFHCRIFTTRMRIGFFYKCSSAANFSLNYSPHLATSFKITQPRPRHVKKQFWILDYNCKCSQ